MAKNWIPGLRNFVKRHKIKRDKWGRLLLFKAVRDDRNSIWITSSINFSPSSSYPAPYTDGAEVSCLQYNTNRYQDCGKGLHVATFAFAKSFVYFCHQHVVLVAVEPEDVVCVPLYGGGKIRCKKLYVIGQVNKKTGLPFKKR